MSVQFVRKCLASIESGEIKAARARGVFQRVFRIMCWEFLDDAQRGRLTACVETIAARLERHEIKLEEADADITGLIEAAIRRDADTLDAICARHQPVPAAAGERTGIHVAPETDSPSFA
jgi:hypothetical protein